MPPGLLHVPMPPQEKLAEIASLVNLTVAFPVLVTVVVFMGLVLPAAMLPKAMLVGLAESVPAVTVPVPESGTVRVAFEALDAIVMVPLTVPAAVGVNFAL